MMQSEPANKDRFLVEALRLITAERDIEFSSFSHDWILRLHRNDSSHYIYGYNFDLNPASAALISNDKSALSDVLQKHAIPHVEHILFLKPSLFDYIGTDGNWSRAMQYVQNTDYPIVCKSNKGTGGNNVFKVNNQTELEAAFQEIHMSTRGLVLSPYYPIEAEYRVILLQGEELLCYKKQRPSVVGDGRSTFLELIQSDYSYTSELLTAALEEPCIPLDKIPEKDSKIPIIWKHNLGKGSTPLFSLSVDVRKDIVKLAQKACTAVGMQFASIDVVQTRHEMKVMEINAGVMLENLSRFSDEGRSLAFGVYARAVDAMFELKNQR